MPSVDLTPRLARDAKPGAKDTFLFDRSLPGFGLRIHPSGRKVYIVQARIAGRSRRIVIARHGEMALAHSRRRARDLLGRIRAGENPADDIRREKETPTLREFAEEYLRRSDPHWKPSGRKTVRIYLKARILPAFGTMALDRIGAQDVAAWFDAASRDRPGAANRAFEILRAMMFRAEEWSLRERGANPCLGIRKNPGNHVARFLDAHELARLGRALDAREARWPEAVAAIRLLALTGCRRSEVLNLRWRDIGPDAIDLRDTKTGPRAAPLGEAARAHIGALPGARGPDAFLFPRYADGRGQDSLIACWRTACADAKLGRLRLHDLRHTAASQAVMSGENLPLVGKLLGHRRHRTTAGYAHLADAHLVEAAEQVGSLIAKAMCAHRERAAGGMCPCAQWRQEAKPNRHWPWPSISAAMEGWGGRSAHPGASGAKYPEKSLKRRNYSHQVHAKCAIHCSVLRTTRSRASEGVSEAAFPLARRLDGGEPGGASAEQIFS